MCKRLDQTRTPNSLPSSGLTIAVMRGLAALLVAAICGLAVAPPAATQQQSGGLTALSRERLVLQTQFGDLHLAFYPQVRCWLGWGWCKL